MITVNLRPGKRRKSSGTSFNFKGMLDNFRGLGNKVKDPLLLGAVAGWVCVLAFLGFVYLNNVRQLYSLEPRLEQARSEHKRFKAFIADKRRQEKIRDSLLAQITVIRSVDGDRYIWAHLLDEVTKALPAYTWLVDLASSAPAPAPAAQTPPARPGAPADTTDPIPAPGKEPFRWHSRESSRSRSTSEPIGSTERPVRSAGVTSACPSSPSRRSVRRPPPIP